MDPEQNEIYHNGQSEWFHDFTAVISTDLDKYCIQMPYLLFTLYHLM